MGSIEYALARGQPCGWRPRKKGDGYSRNGIANCGPKQGHANPDKSVSVRATIRSVVLFTSGDTVSTST
jgi:hypothetical protein